MERREYKTLSPKTPVKRESIIFKAPEKEFRGFPDVTTPPPKQNGHATFTSPETDFCGFPEEIGTPKILNGHHLIFKTPENLRCCNGNQKTTSKPMNVSQNFSTLGTPTKSKIEISQLKTPPSHTMLRIRENRQPKTDVSMIVVRKTYEKISPLLLNGSPSSTKSVPRSDGSGSDTDTTESNQEEFYKYLGIHMRPHEIIHRPDITDYDIFKRRSLRVRYQKIVSSQVKCEEGCSKDTQSPSKEETELVKEDEPKEMLSTSSSVEKVSDNVATKKVTSTQKIREIMKRRVNYLMRSQVCDKSLRSGTKRRDGKSPRYLSIFKNRKISGRKILLKTQKKLLSKVKKVKTRKERKTKIDEKRIKPLEIVTTEVIIPTMDTPVSPPPLAPDSTVNLRCSIDSGNVAINVVSSHTDLNTLKNPLCSEDGEVLHVYNVGEILIVVQVTRVSFWKYSKFKHLIGAEQSYELIGRCRRHNGTDIEINTHNSNRLCLNEKDPVYIELRARQLPSAVGQSPLASVYSVIYALDPKKSLSLLHDKVTCKFVQLDSVQASAREEICFTTIPGTRYIVMGWCEHQIENNRTGVCKYSFTPDLSVLASIRDFPTIKHQVTDLRCLNDTKLIGLGSSGVSIWNHINGDLLSSVDFCMSIGRNLSCFEYLDDVINCLFLIQFFECALSDKKTVKVLGINLDDASWRILKVLDIPSNFNISDIRIGSTSNVLVNSLDYGRHLIIMSQTDAQCIKFISNQNDHIQFFFFEEKVIEVSDKSIVVRGLDEYLMQL